jgi:hypothetical protein
MAKRGMQAVRHHNGNGERKKERKKERRWRWIDRYIDGDGLIDT